MSDKKNIKKVTFGVEVQDDGVMILNDGNGTRVIVEFGHELYMSMCTKIANEQLETTKAALPIDNISDSVCYKPNIMDCDFEYKGKCSNPDSCPFQTER